MKLSKITMLIMAALFMVACDDTTDSIGSSINNRVDNLDISDATFNVTTSSRATNHVLSNNSKGIIGMVKDPETGSYVTGEYMAQFSTLSTFQLDTLEYIRYAHGGKYNAETGKIEGGEIHADSCYILVNYESTYGDTLAPMQVTTYELSKPMPEGKQYYSDFDPIAEGYVNTANAYQANATYSLKNNYFKIYLNKPYTKDGKEYKNYGDYLMNTRNEHPEYFKNNYQFVQHVCPGFYIKHQGGIGNMAKVNVVQLVFGWNRKKPIKSYDGLRDSSETKYYSYPFYSTDEVLRTNKITNDQESIQEMVGQTNCTYIKSPAGILTEAILPVEEIMRGHENDTLAAATITFPRMNNSSTDNEYTLPTPETLLLMPADSLDTYFENGNIINYRTSYTATYNSTSSSLPQNAYTYNNISNLIAEMYKVPQNQRSENWNKVVLVPVSISYVTRDNAQYISKITHDMGLSSTRLYRGDSSKDSQGNPASPVQIKVIYSKFKE